MADLERANERATSAERETEKLKHQLNNLTASLGESRDGPSQKGPDMEQAIEILQRSNLEAELAAKEKEVLSLTDQNIILDVCQFILYVNIVSLLFIV